MVKNSPERSCLGCRKVTPKPDLLRFVLAPDLTLFFDIHSKLPGRGAYTCTRRSCLAEALRRNQFSRVFKVSVNVGPAESFINDVATRLEDRIASYVALANKAGKIISGTDMVEDAIKRNNAGIVIVAADVSFETGQKITTLCARRSIPCCLALTRDRLGALVGKGLRSAVTIQPGGFVAPVLKEIERFRNFSEEGAHE